jgi:chromosome segregation ATPase
MASPSSTPVRRRQRSTRMVVACTLIAVAALAVAGAALSGSWVALTVAGVLAVALGAAATRITHAELADSRWEAARDRAAQAQGYRDLTVARTAENAAYVAATSARLSAHERTIQTLQHDLEDAQGCLVEAHQKLVAEQRRAEEAERDVATLRTRLDDAEERAAQAIVRVAEIEQELDVVTAEWQAAQVTRKHA